MRDDFEHKSDWFRWRCVDLMRKAKDDLIKAMRQGGKDDLLKQVVEANYSTIARLRVAVAFEEKGYSDNQSVQWNIQGSIADGAAIPYIFDDPELVKDILDSRLGSVPKDALRLPHDVVLFELPEPVLMPDASGDKWNIAVIRKEEMEIKQGTTIDSKSVLDDVIVGYLLNTFNGKLTWFHTALRDVSEFHDNCVIDENGEILEKDNTDVVQISKYLLQVLKLVFFVTSPTCKVEIIKRSKPTPRVPWSQRHRFHKVNVIKLPRTKKRYEYDEPGGSGRHLTVRFTVIGHFKHHTKGRLAGRVIWCPPHWKGPDLAQQVERKYIVGNQE